MPLYKGILFKVGNNDAAVYLLGVSHVTTTDSNTPTNTLNQIFKESSILFLEADSTALKKNALNLPVGRDLFQDIDGKTQSTLQAWAETGFFINPELLANMRMNEVYASYAYMKNAGGIYATAKARESKFSSSPLKNTKTGIENVLLDLAKKQNKEFAFLESPLASPSEWKANCNTIAKNSQLLLAVGEFMKNYTQTTEELIQIDRAIARGNLMDVTMLRKKFLQNWLDEEITEKCVDIPRNLHWIVKIKELLKDKKPALIVVGAAHLVGEKNVIQLLQQDGFRATYILQN